MTLLFYLIHIKILYERESEDSIELPVYIPKPVVDLGSQKSSKRKNNIIPKNLGKC